MDKRGFRHSCHLHSKQTAYQAFASVQQGIAPPQVPLHQTTCPTSPEALNLECHCITLHLPQHMEAVHRCAPQLTDFPHLPFYNPNTSQGIATTAHFRLLYHPHTHTTPGQGSLSPFPFLISITPQFTLIVNTITPSCHPHSKLRPYTGLHPR